MNEEVWDGVKMKGYTRRHAFPLRKGVSFRRREVISGGDGSDLKVLLATGRRESVITRRFSFDGLDQSGGSHRSEDMRWPPLWSSCSRSRNPPYLTASRG
jgi:hypothetical protein